jgi:hypothetical protein
MQRRCPTSFRNSTTHTDRLRTIAAADVLTIDQARSCQN